jgi:hypothetical protein
MPAEIIISSISMFVENFFAALNPSKTKSTTLVIYSIPGQSIILTYKRHRSRSALKEISYAYIPQPAVKNLLLHATIGVGNL